jgi:dTDP-4-dehydrorhamnose 3,5-epimerase
MSFFSKANLKYTTKDKSGDINGFLIPIYNVNDKDIPENYTPKQVYLTTVGIGKIKGPHLHYKRDGFFTCIKGNVRIILKIDGKYITYFSGENHEYLSIFIPKGIPAAIQNISDEEAFLLNMPNPAWTKEMNDEFTSDFSDFNFDKF